MDNFDSVPIFIFKSTNWLNLEFTLRSGKFSTAMITMINKNVDQEI